MSADYFSSRMLLFCSFTFIPCFRFSVSFLANTTSSHWSDRTF